MRDRLLQWVLIAAWAAGCSGTDEPATAPTTTTSEATRVLEAPPTTTVISAPPTTPSAPATSLAPVAVTHGGTAAERVSRMQANGGEATRMQERHAHLREGRRLAHANDHEGALRELEAGLAITPTDATLRCEAGLQAYRLGRLDAALDHLNRGVARAGAPPPRPTTSASHPKRRARRCARSSSSTSSRARTWRSLASSSSTRIAASVSLVG